METSLFKRSIFVLFLGWPGMVLWLCGFACLVFGVAEASVGLTRASLDAVISIVSSAGAAFVGFLMFNAARMLTGSLPLEVPIQRIAALLGYQIGAFLFGAIACGCLPAIVLRLFGRSFDLQLFLTMAIAIMGVVVTTTFYRSRRKLWLAESPEERP